MMRSSLQAGPAGARGAGDARFPGRASCSDLLAAHRDEVQGMGYACLGNRATAYTMAARDAGVAFVAPLETIQDPPAGWRADGRSGLAELLRCGR